MDEFLHAINISFSQAISNIYLSNLIIYFKCPTYIVLIDTLMSFKLLL